MNWDDTGFLLSKNRYNENSLISEFYTKNHGKISGIVFGGTSKKIKNYLQIGNQLYLNYNSKSENKIGYFKLEIQKVYSPIYFENSQKLSCINSAMSLIRLLTAESQSNINKIIEDILNPASTFSNRDLLEKSFTSPLKEARKHFEKEYLITQLKKNHGNISKTADFIGMERSALHRKLKELGIKGIN